MFEGRKLAFVKGAVDMLLDRCSKMVIAGIEIDLTTERRAMIEKINSQMAGKALRVLGFAYKCVDDEKRYKEDNLVFLGMVGMIDPPRK